MALDGGAILDSLTKKAETLKPGSEIVIKMTQEDLGKNLQGKLKDGSFFEYDPQKKQVVIYKPKKKNYSCAREALKEGLNLRNTADACSDEIHISLDMEGLKQQVKVEEQQVKVEEQQVKVKEQQVKVEEQQVKVEGQQVKVEGQQVKVEGQQVKVEEQQVKELEKMVKKDGYLGYLQDKVILIGQNVDNKKLVLDVLDEIIKKMKLRNLRGNEYGEQIGRVLKQLKTIYKLKGDSIIPSKVTILLKKLNLE